MPFAWIALFPPRVVRDLVAHHREHDVAQLPRHGRDGHAVGLALGALPVVEGAQPRVVLPGAVGRQPQSAAKVRRAVLGYGAAAAVELPGLAHRRVQPGVAHQGGRVAGSATRRLSRNYLGARDVGHPGIVSTSGSTSSSRDLSLASTPAHSESANSICLIRDLTWNEAASWPSLTPIDDLAAALIFAA